MLLRWGGMPGYDWLCQCSYRPLHAKALAKPAARGRVGFLA
jgi:hypothetical protein